MTEEIKAAAERLRKHKAMLAELRLADPLDLAVSWIGLDDDLRLLADAYLAEHDPTPIDETSLLSDGLPGDGTSHEHFFHPPRKP